MKNVSHEDCKKLHKEYHGSTYTTIYSLTDCSREQLWSCCSKCSRAWRDDDKFNQTNRPSIILSSNTRGTVGNI